LPSKSSCQAGEFFFAGFGASAAKAGQVAREQYAVKSNLSFNIDHLSSSVSFTNLGKPGGVVVFVV
jgi:hypothetical protein